MKHMTSFTDRRPLTKKQQAIYDFIRSQIVEKHISPTVREIADNFGMVSSNGVMCHLRPLEKKGWIKRDYFKSRGISLIPEPSTQLVSLSIGEAGTLGELYVRCIGVGDDGVTLELIAPDTMGEFVKAE